MTTVLDEVNKFITSRLEEAEELRAKLLTERKIHMDKIAEIDEMLAKLPGAKKPAKNGGGKKLSPLAKHVIQTIQYNFEKSSAPTREEVIRVIDPKANDKNRGKIWLAIQELQDSGLLRENSQKGLEIIGP